MRTLVLALLLLSSPLHAASYHVSDKVVVPMRTGPSDGYRIRGWLEAGTPLQLLEQNSETGYRKVRDDKGREGWIAGEHFAEGESVRTLLPKLEQKLAQTEEKLSQQQQLVEQLQADLAESNDRRAEALAKVAQAQNEIDRLNAQLAAMDETNLMGWFVRGAGVAIAGLVLGLLLPHLPRRRRRNDEWF